MENKIAKLGLICILLVVYAVPSAAVVRPTDNQITGWVEQALQTDYRLNDSNLAATTHSGIVTLTGEVTTLAAKKYAALEALKIRGVLGVVNEINVRASNRSDTGIRRDLRLRYLDSLDPQLQNINFRVTDGRVTLAGRVDSESQRKRAGLIAAEVQGVTTVDNHLAIVVIGTRSDQQIHKDILDTLGRDVYFTDLFVDVKVQNGIVTLRGVVATAYQKERAAQDSLRVANVKAVRNDLVVRMESDSSGIRRQAPVPTDTQLHSNVREELLQDSRIVKPSRIKVEVQNGHITLHGVVASHYQQLLVVQDAHAVAGVAAVTDLTTVGTERRGDRSVHE